MYQQGCMLVNLALAAPKSWYTYLEYELTCAVSIIARLGLGRYFGILKEYSTEFAARLTYRSDGRNRTDSYWCPGRFKFRFAPE